MEGDICRVIMWAAAVSAGMYACMKHVQQTYSLISLKRLAVQSGRRGAACPVLSLPV